MRLSIDCYRKLSIVTKIVWLIFLVCLFISVSGFADIVNTNKFSIESANQKFDQISLKLSTQNLNAHDFKSAIEQLTELQSEAEDCAQKNQRALSHLTENFKNVELDGGAVKSENNVTTYLVEKKDLLQQRVTRCHLFVIRSSEAIEAYTETLHQLRASILLDRETPFFEYLAQPNQIKLALSQMRLADIVQKFFIEKWYVFLLILALYVAYIFIIHYSLRHPVKRNDDDQESSSGSPLRKIVYTRLKLLGFAVFVVVLIEAALFYSGTSIVVIRLMQIISMTIISALLFWLSFVLRRVVKYKSTAYTLLVGIFLFFTLIISVAGVGYYTLIQYILQSIFLTIVGLLVVLVYKKIQDMLSQSLNERKYLWQKKLRFYFDIREDKTMPELSILKFTVMIAIWVLYIGYLVTVWGWKTVYPDRYFYALVDGFEVVRIYVQPLQVFIAVITFVVLSLCGRLVSGSIARKNRRQEKDLQVAFASIIAYLSFGVAILIALLVSGVNFTGLVIIAGALSVGVGLGLQDIVNNFVSGIILLLEKPIKPGDRIIVGETEGFVKRVRVRSTRISTMSKADVIVPNADLIKNQVTNYMFRDPYWRIECKVGVVYGSDTDLVKKVLLEVAQAHPNIVQDEENKPSVLFKEFADSSLNFELWCIIKNVNSKYVIQSDLNFAIDKAFREHNITIAFPQRDVHLYQHSDACKPIEKKNDTTD